MAKRGAPSENATERATVSERESNGDFAKGNKLGTGRKSLYKEEYEEMAYRLCMLGLTNAELAKAFDVHVDTIYEWKSVHSGFSDALTRGKAIADADVAVSLYKRACGYEHDAEHFSAYEGKVTATQYTKRYPPDTPAALSWLKNRQPEKWRDKQEIAHDVTGLEIAGDLLYRKDASK